MALPATKVSAPASATRRMLSTLMPPSTSSRMSRPLASISLRTLLDLAQRAVDEALPAEAGVHAHQQDQVDLVDRPLQHVERHGRVEHQAGLAAGADQLQRAVDMGRWRRGGS
jgi:hypothetical protein